MTHQPRIPSLLTRAAVLHYCLNKDCFYVDSILDLDDIVWKEVWNSEIEDLDMIPHCPSCQEVLYREVNDDACAEKTHE